MQPKPNQLPVYIPLGEPELLFHPDRPNDTHRHPLEGLLKYGPFSRSLRQPVSDPIRIAVICPEGSFPKVRGLFGQLQVSHTPRERKNYLPSFPGFAKVFGVGIDCPQDVRDGRVVQIGVREIQAALNSETPPERLAELVHRGLRRLHSIQSQFDVAVLYFPDWCSLGFRSLAEDETADYDLHDSIKGLCSSLYIATQLIRDHSMEYFCRCSVAWRLSIALYAKAGGTPWKLAGMDERTAYVGIRYCVRKGKENRFVTCCSQLFDSKGTCLRFLLHESQDGRYEGDNPYLPRHDMHRVMSRVLSQYQRHSSWAPTRVVVHKTTQFTEDEIDGCCDAFSSVDNLELLTVNQNTAWRGIKYNSGPLVNGQRKPATATGYPLDRGIILPIGHFDFLLWVQGDCVLKNGKNYFKEGKGIPHPLLITRHLGSGGFHLPAWEILGLSKMDWNNDSLYNYIPVTLQYSAVLSRVVKRTGSLSSSPYDFRYFF